MIILWNKKTGTAVAHKTQGAINKEGECWADACSIPVSVPSERPVEIDGERLPGGGVARPSNMRTTGAFFEHGVIAYIHDE